MNPTLRISGFGSKDDNDPVPAEVTWQQLVDALGATPRAAACVMADKCWEIECPHKNGHAWSPAYWPVGYTRAKLTVEAVSVLIIDVDHIANNDDLVAIYERITPWRHFVHGSHSDRPGDRCVRVGLAVSRPIRGNEFPRVLRTVLQMLELPGDPRTKDASRIFYWPSRPSDACGSAADGSGYLFLQGEGKILDVDAILALAGPETEIEYSNTEFEVPDFEGAPTREALETAAKIIADAWPDDDRHMAQLALAGALARAGWPADLISGFCMRVAELDEPGNMKHVRLAPSSARASYDKVRAGEAVAGWPTVIEFCGEDAIKAARNVLGLDTMPVPDPAFASTMRTLVEAQIQATAQAPAPTLPEELAASMTQVQATLGPTNVQVEATLAAARRKLSSSKKSHEATDGAYLAKVHSNEPISDLQEAFEATLAVVQYAPPGTTDDQIRRLLMHCGSWIQDPELLPLARVKVEERRAQRAAQARIEREAALPLDQFTLLKSGPRAGQPDGRQHNLGVALRRLGVELSYNEFTDREIIERDDKCAEVMDSHVNDLFMEIERAFDIQAEDGYFSKWIGVKAHERSFHPIREYLDALDPLIPITDLTETWLIRYGGAEDTPYVRAVSRLMLVAAVRRVRRPGCKFDEMPILEGEQGIGKSTLLKVLAVNPEWHTDDFELDADDDKRMIEQTSGKWIVEAPELSGMSRADHKRLKKWLSKQSDRARLAYGKRPREFKRQFLVVGTTNDDQYLVDSTGNRRYWPIKLTRPIDKAEFAAVVPQLWAEASRLERENPHEEYIRLDPSLYAAASAEQDQRQIDHPYKIKLEDAIGGTVGRIPVMDVWKLLGFDGRNPNQLEQAQIGSVMRAMKFERTQVMLGGVRQYFYVRGDGAQRNITLTVSGMPATGFTVRAVAAAAPRGAPTPPLAAIPDQSN